VGCFSFFSNKNLSTGEGGMLVTNREDLAQKLRLLRSHGMTSLTWDRHQGHAYSYDVIDLGYNYRIDEIRSALGRVQLGKLVENNARRKALTQSYWQALGESEFGLPFRAWGVHAGVEPAYHIFPILLPDGAERRLFMDRLREAGVQTSIHYPPIHQFSYYQQRFSPPRLPITEQAAAREVTLPLYPKMRAEDQALVIQAALRAIHA
jgi:dTDP-4-amino-4,6-dideoxygalactose transaminase